MRVLLFLLTAAITGVLILLLNRPIGDKVPMAVGSFLSPQTGFWQNAEDTSQNFSQSLQFANLKGKVEVYFDDRLVPHVFAEQDEDLYFVQGYLHAKFRLFQMDLQTKAAEGRASEIAGAKAINFDREQRRLGMKYAAEKALQVMEANQDTKQLYSAYTAGINAYIHSLTAKDLPFEYKLLNFQPEEWTNLRTALLLKMMAKMLSSGTENDIAFTNLKAFFSNEQINALYPQVPDSLAPIVPKGSKFESPNFKYKIPKDVDSAYFGKNLPINAEEKYKADPNNGSNNWAVAGTKTESGRPILCNDPHLELSLPSIWYEMQLSTPTNNTYGVTLPGSPYVIIGFNDSIAWGVTNAQRDVKDFYKIKFRDETKAEYWFDSTWKPTQQRIEEIKVKGAPSIFDTVSYTVFGPVMFDNSFRDTVSHQSALALKWVAHETGDDGATFFKLNHANNYDDYLNAIKTFESPAQNFVFASKSGVIAIWQQGKFPNRWPGQGMYVMPGEDSSYLWQGYIPQAQNPHVLNPERGFVESGNQRPVDGNYPYFIPGKYITPRGIAIDNYLTGMSAITIQDMMKLQYNYFNVMAEDFVPLLLRYTNSAALNATALSYLQEIKSWDFYARPDSKAQTIYQLWVDSVRKNIWADELRMSDSKIPLPEEQTTLEILKKDSTALGFVNNKLSNETEDIHSMVSKSLNEVADYLSIKEKEGKLHWASFKGVTIYHLLRESLLPFAAPNLNVGGWSNTINAVTKSHGPSWRMIVELTDTTTAYGVYPGGQSGNPGSKYYDNFIKQ